MPIPKPSDNLLERRKYIRLEAPVSITYNAAGDNKFYTSVAKNISADGIRFETDDRLLKQSDLIDVKLDIPGASNPVHSSGKVVWKKKLSLEDAAPSDVGVEFIKIEEDNKNTFLKFLCDVLYSIT